MKTWLQWPPRFAQHHGVRFMLLLAFLVVVYYASSAAAGVLNKYMVDQKAGGPAWSASGLTLVHLITALGSDYAIIRATNDHHGSSRLASDHKRTLWDVVVAFAPIALLMVGGKVATYASYSHGSIALAQSAKAAEPIFNVIIAGLAFGEYHSREVYLTLVPITAGIVLSSVTDLTFNLSAFAVGALSALFKVLQNLYTKRVFDAGKFTFWEVHLFCGAGSLAMLGPWMLLQLLLTPTAPGADAVTAAAAAASAAAAQPSSVSFPFLVFILLVDTFLQWVSSVSSYMLLSLVPTLTATIINVCKRLVLIVSGEWWYASASPVAVAGIPLNTLGVLLATGGIVAYHLVRDVGSSNGSGGGSGNSSPSVLPGGAGDANDSNNSNSDGGSSSSTASKQAQLHMRPLPPWIRAVQDAAVTAPQVLNNAVRSAWTAAAWAAIRRWPQLAEVLPLAPVLPLTGNSSGSNKRARNSADSADLSSYNGLSGLSSGTSSSSSSGTISSGGGAAAHHYHMSPPDLRLASSDAGVPAAASPNDAYSRRKVSFSTTTSGGANGGGGGSGSSSTAGGGLGVTSRPAAPYLQLHSITGSLDVDANSPASSAGPAPLTGLSGQALSLPFSGGAP